MIDAKTRKQRLFRRSRPQVRPFAIQEGAGYSRDMGVLWAAYSAGSFKAPLGMGQSEFVEFVKGWQDGADSISVVDDDNGNFKSGRGPVAIVASRAEGLIQEPVFVFFKWASCRNVLRVMVAYLTMAKSSTKTGLLLVRAGAVDGLFCGRLLLPTGPSALAPLRTARTFHWPRQLASLERLRSWLPAGSPDWIASGGGLGALRGDKLVNGGAELLAGLVF
jgi:hypothetical protein